MLYVRVRLQQCLLRRLLAELPARRRARSPNRWVVPGTANSSIACRTSIAEDVSHTIPHPSHRSVAPTSPKSPATSGLPAAIAS